MMKTTRMLVIGFLLAVLPADGATVSAASPETPLTAAGQNLEARYADQLKALQAEVTKAVPQIDEQKKAAFLEAAKDSKSAAAQDKASKAFAELNLAPFLTDAKLDPKLVRLVVLRNATPRGLAEFAQQGAEQATLVDKLLADSGLMKQLLVADGTKENKYGRAMEIYAAIQKASAKAKEGVMQRLALAIALEHAAPVKQSNPAATPFFPPSGPATGFSIGPHLKSKFLAVSQYNQ